jgi:hypothetical protein
MSMTLDDFLGMNKQGGNIAPPRIYVNGMQQGNPRISNDLDFFLPFEFDQVPATWDPWSDTWTEGDKKYIWDCFKNPPFDGILISKTKFDENCGTVLAGELNIKKALHFPENVKLFGDCGAFEYRNEKRPPYSASEVLS